MSKPVKIVFLVNTVLLAAATLVLGIVVGDDRMALLGVAGAGLLIVVVYARRRTSPQAHLLLMSTNLSIGLAFLVLANIVYLEPLLNLQVTSTLTVSCQLREVLNSKVLKRDNTFENYGSDALFYRRKPGTTHHNALPDRSTPRRLLDYTVQVDETGYLNLDRGTYNSRPAIDVFVSGDSVLQGTAMPSVFERFKKENVSIWNLSTGSYSPRQKVTALSTFAPPKHARWMVTDFFAGNDVSEIMTAAVCADHGDGFVSLFCQDETERLLCQDSDFIQASCCDWLESRKLSARDRLIENRLFLAVLRHYWDILKPASARAPSSASSDLAAPHAKDRACYVIQAVNHNDLPFMVPAYSHFAIKKEKQLEWVKTGLAAVMREYDRLRQNAAAANAEVILVYNPTGYEIYRDFLPVESRNSLADEVSALQRATLRQYSEAHRIRLFDFTDEFRTRALDGGFKYIFSDGIHWNELGTDIAYDAFTRAFNSVGILPN